MPRAEIIKHPIAQAGNDVKKTAWSAVIESLCIIVIGVLFVAWPDTMARVVSYVVGIIFIAKGIYQVINYFIEKGQRDFFNNDLLFGVVSILIGVAALIIGQEIANIFRIVVGILLIYEALARVNTAIKLSAAGIVIWKYVLIIAIAVLLLGIFVTFNDVSTIIGWMMVLAGAIGIVGDILFIQRVDSLIERYTEHERNR